MKSLHSLVCLAALAFLAVPALASSGPPDAQLRGPMDLATVVAPTELARPTPAGNVCVFAIVEDLATCQIAVAAVSGICPAIVARVIGAMGQAALASRNFAASCAPPAAAPD